MQSVLTHEQPQRKKREYANDGSLESVEDMLMGLAKVFYGRVQALGLPMTFDDLMQEMRLAYVKAHAKWTPDKAKFTTYCYTVARNELNRRIERMAHDRVHFGMVSIDNLVTGIEDESAGDGYERYLSEESPDDSPDMAIERRETMKEQLAKLSPHARAVVTVLMRDELSKSTNNGMTFTQAAVHLGLAGPAIKAVQRELRDAFGVQLIYFARKAAEAS